MGNNPNNFPFDPDYDDVFETYNYPFVTIASPIHMSDHSPLLISRIPLQETQYVSIPGYKISDISGEEWEGINAQLKTLLENDEIH